MVGVLGFPAAVTAHAGVRLGCVRGRSIVLRVCALRSSY